MYICYSEGVHPYTSPMNISLSQQVSATYARNHFKEVTEMALQKGACFIMRKSKPSTVVLSMQEYQKLQEKYEQWHKFKEPKVQKKITLEELRKNSIFKEHIGTMKDEWPGLTSVEVAKKWTDYVD